MKKILIGMIFSLLLSGSITDQIYPLPIDAVDSVMQKEAKPILILLTTDWCQYCNMQKNQIQKNKAFEKGADNFYYVEFDAESREKNTFNQQEFEFQPADRLHELTLALNKTKQISYPTWVLLDSNYHTIFKHNGVLLPKQINELITAIRETSSAN